MYVCIRRRLYTRTILLYIFLDRNLLEYKIHSQTIKWIRKRENEKKKGEEINVPYTHAFSYWRKYRNLIMNVTNSKFLKKGETIFFFFSFSTNNSGISITVKWLTIRIIWSQLNYNNWGTWFWKWEKISSTSLSIKMYTIFLYDLVMNIVLKKN